MTLPGALRDEPIIASLPQHFDVKVTIGRAHIEEDSGWVILDMEGEDAVVDDAVAWLEARGVKADRIGAGGS